MFFSLSLSSVFLFYRFATGAKKYGQRKNNTRGEEFDG
jgi:hypothetical protein